jgi:hypothetical protein
MSFKARPLQNGLKGYVVEQRLETSTFELPTNSLPSTYNPKGACTDSEHYFPIGLTCLPTGGQQVAALGVATLADTHLRLQSLHLRESVLRSQLLLPHLHQLLLLSHHLLLLSAHLQQRLDLGEEEEAGSSSAGRGLLLANHKGAPSPLWHDLTRATDTPGEKVQEGTTFLEVSLVLMLQASD